ncbi:MAG: protein translocase subunit SecD [Actinomycetota bacterium]
MKGGRRHVISILFVAVLVGVAVSGFVFGGLRPLLGLDLVGGVSVILTAPDGTTPEVVDRALETVRTRVDRLGVAEPEITLQGDLNIQVQIPRFGGRSQERLLTLIGTTARLEFREVLETLSPGSEEYEAAEPTRGEPPDDEEAVFPAADVAEGQDPTLFRLSPVLMTGKNLTEARAQFQAPGSTQDPTQEGWRVDFEFNAEGGEQFGNITEDLVGKQLAIILDRKVESAPNVESAITGGSGQITGGFGEQEARDLALVLQTGALPVELEQSQVETVSATLGRESLRLGLVAGIAGLIALCLYLAFYYRLLGIVTWFGMAIWSVLALAIISLLGRAAGYSLTLAGIAGLIVALGITADSYIVFYERLKDEVRKGKTVRASVGPAFARAWKTIVAADIVTISAAVVLYLLAIGSVRGFALTLGMATLLDMFVVYFFKRPTVFLIARSRALSELRGMGLRSAVAVGDTQPEPVRGGSK